ncbi:MAG: hypothetical protein N2738_09170 [Thermodesulfovibrionales bacterium]|nr:hypothetical protein [Thermodesulfovibrionales bacterium]
MSYAIGSKLTGMVAGEIEKAAINKETTIIRGLHKRLKELVKEVIQCL